MCFFEREEWDWHGGLHLFDIIVTLILRKGDAIPAQLGFDTLPASGHSPDVSNQQPPFHSYSGLFLEDLVRVPPVLSTTTNASCYHVFVSALSLRLRMSDITESQKIPMVSDTSGWVSKVTFMQHTFLPVLSTSNIAPCYYTPDCTLN